MSLERKDSIMVEPRKVKFAAKKKENENIKFRTFLKGHADPEELDKQFLELHNELFANYDCNRCRNCCKEFYGEIPAEEVERDAVYLGLDIDQFKLTYLVSDEFGIKYRTKNMPCDFLLENGDCMLGDCKPDNCKKYPYTNQPDRMESLLGMLNAVEVCPVAYEIFERLKKIYGFR